MTTPTSEIAEVREAVKYFRKLQSNATDGSKLRNYIETLIRSASQPVQEVTVDTLMYHWISGGEPKDVLGWIADCYPSGVRIVKTAQRGEG